MEVDACASKCHFRYVFQSTQGTKFTDYVADFAVDNEDRIWIIELNPFEPSTDGAMFSWHRESSILRGEGGTLCLNF